MKSMKANVSCMAMIAIALCICASASTATPTNSVLATYQSEDGKTTLDLLQVRFGHKGVAQTESLPGGQMSWTTLPITIGDTLTPTCDVILVYLRIGGSDLLSVPTKCNLVPKNADPLPIIGAQPCPEVNVSTNGISIIKFDSGSVGLRLAPTNVKDMLAILVFPLPPVPSTSAITGIPGFAGIRLDLKK